MDNETMLVYYLSIDLSNTMVKSKAQRGRNRQNKGPNSGLQKSGARRRRAGRRGQNLDGSGFGRPQMVGAAVSRRIQSTAPRITRTARGMRIQHRELVVPTIAGATTFTVQNRLALNPGLAATFPWLAPQAIQWQEYTCHALRAEYIPIAPTSKAGDVIISPDYDASDPTPTTELQISDNYDTVEDSCWRDIEVNLTPSAMHPIGPRKYVRPCAIAGDIKTYDVGALFVAVNNEADTTSVGKMWLEYDFEFFVPQNSPSPATFPQGTSFFTNHASTAFTTTVAKAVPWDTIVFDPLTLGTPAAGVFTPPAGCYKIQAQITSEDSVAETFQGVVEILKNGAVLTNRARCNFLDASVAAVGEIDPMFVQAVVPMNGTDTFQVQLTLTGAAGSLTTVANSCQLIVSLA